jgi:ribosomal protein L37AE/L43A
MPIINLNMSECPCCNGTLLRHVRNSKIYWFCVDCRQEMPDMSSVVHAKSLSSAVLSAKIRGKSL